MTCLTAKWGDPEFKEQWLAYIDAPGDERAWAAKCELMERLSRGHVESRLTVIRDIEPYRAVATDIALGRPPEIMGRAQHREFLKRNNYNEVGNEMPKPRRDEAPDYHAIGREIKSIIDQKGIKL
jgi:hypothetical protein